MADWKQIPDTDVDPDAPVTSELMYALRDNPAAMAEGAVGAPRVTLSAAAEPTFGDDFILYDKTGPVSGLISNFLTVRAGTLMCVFGKSSGWIGQLQLMRDTQVLSEINTQTTNKNTVSVTVQPGQRISLNSNTASQNATLTITSGTDVFIIPG